MKPDSYNIIARIFPGIISLIPFFVFHFFYLRPVLGQFWKELLGLQIASDITMVIVLLFALVQLNRILSKELFEKKIFNEGYGLPTTDYLLHINDHFSAEYTRKIHDKIEINFGIKIPPLSEEIKDDRSSRKLITEAINHVRATVGNGKLVGQHNAEYGFWRNLAGGSIVSSVMSLINIAVFGFISINKTALYVSIVVLVLFLLYFAFAKRTIISSGHDYAKILIQEYMIS